ncbi:hypothetical protein FRC10_003846 [Ceratobasidium sp. 414]|nr:hypothetical protein FRC10_003846 [Ceratobasidium sp. 414]
MELSQAQTALAMNGGFCYGFGGAGPGMVGMGGFAAASNQFGAPQGFQPAFVPAAVPHGLNQGLAPQLSMCRVALKSLLSREASQLVVLGASSVLAPVATNVPVTANVPVYPPVPATTVTSVPSTKVGEGSAN